MSVRLYATKRGNGTARLTADAGDVTSVGDLRWSDHRATFDALQDGDSSVVGEWRVTKLADYQAGSIMFDEHAKEYVKVSNGRCVKDHGDTDAFHRSHSPNGTGDCVHVPSEAVALRPVIGSDGVYVGWTIRSVNPCDLSIVRPAGVADIAAGFEAALNPQGTKAQKQKFIGRI